MRDGVTKRRANGRSRAAAAPRGVGCSSPRSRRRGSIRRRGWSRARRRAHRCARSTARRRRPRRWRRSCAQRPSACRAHYRGAAATAATSATADVSAAHRAGRRAAGALRAARRGPAAPPRAAGRRRAAAPALGLRGVTKCGFVGPSGFDALVRGGGGAACDVVVLTAIFGRKDKLQQRRRCRRASPAATLPSSTRRRPRTCGAPRRRDCSARRQWPRPHWRVAAAHAAAARADEGAHVARAEAAAVPPLPARALLGVGRRAAAARRPARAAARLLWRPAAQFAAPRNYRRDRIDDEFRWIRAAPAATRASRKPQDAVEAQCPSTAPSRRGAAPTGRIAPASRARCSSSTSTPRRRAA